MVEKVGVNQNSFLNLKSRRTKKDFGQFFTNIDVANYMSSLIDLGCIPDREIRILDCGAGYGILTLTTALHCLKNGRKDISAVLYELDPKVIEGLTQTMNELASHFQNNAGHFKFEIINGNFVTDRPDKNSEFKFDISVINPPYFKYNVVDSPYSKAVSDLFKGDPNIYASFIAIMVASLNENGQAVVISPRSFLNGLYFKGFRKFLLGSTSLKHIHIFRSRKDVFNELEVLQENIIFKISKSSTQDRDITISSSNGIKDLEKKSIDFYPYDTIIDVTNDEYIIRVPESKNDYRTLSAANNLPSTFSAEGYFISTGRVVDFRTKEFIFEPKNKGTLPLFHSMDEAFVPLIKLHNIGLNAVHWDGTNNKDLIFALKDGYEKHVNKNHNYVFLKRFTSKEEKRRLVAGFYSAKENKYGLIGIVNKINYLGRTDEEIQYVEGIGLAATFNSSFMDNYYRCISGNTQVNATDVRVMKFPSREMIIEIGKELISKDRIDYDVIDKVFSRVTRINIDEEEFKSH